MIDLKDTNSIVVPHGEVDVIVSYPSFADLKDGIAKMLKDRLTVSTKGVKDVSAGARMRFFQDYATAIDGLEMRTKPKAGTKQAHVGTVPLMVGAPDNWKNLVPPNIQAASAMPFDELGTAEIVESAIIGDPVKIEVDTLLGIVTFHFPDYGDEEFTKALKRFVMAERVKQRGRRFELTGQQLNAAFFEKWCTAAEGLANGTDRKELPLNWIVSGCRPFINQEALSPDDLGN